MPPAIVQQTGGYPAHVPQPSNVGYGYSNAQLAAPRAAPALVDPWAKRDSLYGTQIRTPIPAQRRWYYRDLFGDMQGPFNPQEMRQRVDAKHIQPETFCVAEVGTGAVQMFAEKKLKEIFPSLEAAFNQPAVIAGKRQYWYFLDDAKTELGPFSSDQMRLWFDVEGYFGSRTLVREANPGATFAPLKQFYPDPMVCFLDGSAANVAESNSGYQEPLSFQIVDPFQQSSSSSGSSSRQLFQAALSGGPPPAIGKNSAAGGPPAPLPRPTAATAEDDEDDTLALFDQVSLMTEEERKRAEAQKSKVVMRIYGTPSAWPAWKGVPNLTNASKTDAFPTILYHFFTRP